MLFSLASKSALVTGASRGIGRAIAIALAKERCNLYLTCRQQIDALQSLAQELSLQYEISCRAFQTDVCDRAAVDDLFSEIKSLDLVVNNAGRAHAGVLSDTSFDDWDEMIATNLSGAFYVCRKAVPLLLQKDEGRIVNISSVFGATGASCEAAYAASKGGLHALTKSLAKELAPSKIAVNAIAPGVVDTEMNTARLSAEELSALKDEIPAGRFASPNEVAAVVCLFAKAPVYLTGQIVAIDGGWT